MNTYKKNLIINYNYIKKTVINYYLINKNNNKFINY